MKVSIVVPVFDVPPLLLAECLTSVARQTLRADDYEILIVDDASTTPEVADALARFAGAHGNCRVVRHETNRGLNQARLTGVREASGDFVLFVDGDDILSRDAAELLHLEAIRSGADIVTAPLYRWSAERFSYRLSGANVPFPRERLARMEAAFGGRYSLTMCGRLFRRSLLRDSVFEMPERMLHEDLVSTVRALFDADPVTSIPEPIYYYTINASSITMVFTDSQIDGLFYALNDWWRQAEERGLATVLEGAMQRGAEWRINTTVQRCGRASNLSAEEKLSILRDIDQRYDRLPFPRPVPTLWGTRLLARIGSVGPHRTRQALGLVDQPIPPDRWGAPSGSDTSLGPSAMATRLMGKVVIIGQVDYQVRNGARLGRALRQRGIPCVVLDNSGVADKGLRKLTAAEPGLFDRIEHIRVSQKLYDADWLSTASLVVAFNDFTPMFREALEYRHRLGLPSVCMVEGVNDFWRVDFATPRLLSYRRSDYVFLAGADDERYFPDRPTRVVGMPVVAALAERQPTFPGTFKAVLNVNFTYGALEDKREAFVSAAREAFEELGVAWEITRHPMDTGDFTGLPVSSSTQQQLIDDCSVFVSRFATGIIEALASGKPAIYFNPHGERVAKYSEPLGAYDVATSPAELVAALRRVEADIAAGVDFRARAARFLQHHAAYGLPDGRDIGTRFAEAVSGILDAHEAQTAAAAALFLERLDESAPFRRERPGLVLGDFARLHHAQINEEEMIGRCFASSQGLMVDVGANHGNSADVYLGMGWTVHAFEPDPNNRAKLAQLWPGLDRLVINPEAVSDRDGMVVPLYASDESTGISSLAAFTAGHRQVAEVSTVTLATYMASAGIGHVNVLKVDVEGYDKFVLDGFPWDRDHPDAILVEFEDFKTVPLGYDVGDLAEVLLREGYAVYVSEWHPVLRYGIRHDWKSLRRYDPAADLSATWGNLVGFLEDPAADVLARAAIATTRYAVEPLQASKRLRRVSLRRIVQKWRLVWAARADHSRRWLVRELALAVGEGIPLIDRVARAIAWRLRAARRHWLASATFAAAIVAAVLLPLLAGRPDWRAFSWSVAAALLLVGFVVALTAGAWKRRSRGMRGRPGAAWRTR